METLQARLGRILVRGRRPRPAPHFTDLAPVEPEPPAPVEPEPPAPPAPYDARAALRLGYQLFLGRDVEECFVDELAVHYPTVEHLRNYLLHLDEFRCQLAPKRKPPMSGAEPAMQVDEVRSEEELRTLFAHVQATWQRFGETEPHWSVSTAPKFLRENFDENRSEFYDSGRWDAQRFLASLARNGIDASALKTCLELGCGTGRVTAWLAERFESVIGYDISEAHLHLARAYCDEKGLGNVEFRHLARVEDAFELPKVDAVFHVVVLQHNPPPVIAALIAGFLRALNPGGVAFFQVPTYRVGYTFDLASYLTNDATSHEVMEMHVLPQRTLFEIIEREGARAVEIIEDTYTLCPEGEVSSTILIQKR